MEKLKSLHLFTKQTNNYVAFVFKNKTLHSLLDNVDYK